jgi:peptidase E
MLAIWRVHGVDRALRRAWEAGVVLAGMSAGAICWFEGGTTDSFGPELAGFTDGLGFLGGSFSPHYDGEPRRRPLFRRLVGERALPDGLASDDGAAFVFRGTDLLEVVGSTPSARGYRIVRGPAGEAIETELPTRYLG